VEVGGHLRALIASRGTVDMKNESQELAVHNPVEFNLNADFLSSSDLSLANRVGPRSLRCTSGE
jgi:hypothetical protein